MISPTYASPTKLVRQIKHRKKTSRESAKVKQRKLILLVLKTMAAESLREEVSLRFRQAREAFATRH